ncbi:MAG: IclR family transcriptional regulator [Eubacteriales bacterium]
MKITEKPVNQNVAKTLNLLSFLSSNRSPLRLSEIAEGIGMPSATVLRYLNTLMLEGYVFQDKLSERYSLTWKICTLGEQVRMYSSLRTISGDIMTRLYEKLAMGICLVAEKDMECMYLDCIYEPVLTGVSLMRIGKQAPLHATSSGKMMLCQYTDQELEDLIRLKGLSKLTDKTIVDKKSLVEELKRVRKQGFSLDDEECEIGLRCVALPIYGSNNKINAAISVFGLVNILTDEFIESKIIPELKEAATEITLRIGGDIRYVGKGEIL